MRTLFIVGASGHGKVVAEIAEHSYARDEIFFFDDNQNIDLCLEYPVIGRTSDIQKKINDKTDIFIAIGNNSTRLSLIDKFEDKGWNIVSLVHPSAIISRTASIGNGTIIMAGATIQASVSIGRGCIVNTMSSVDHDSELHDGVHLSPGVHIGGTTIICSLTWICIGASISNNLKIGCNSVIAAGAAVIHDVGDNCLFAGVPAQFKKQRSL